MSKYVSSQLFRLIKSLTTAEKRYFKLFASRHTIGEKNDSLVLFDAIDEQKEYDEKHLKMVFKQNTFQTRPAIAKARLFELILKSLDAYHADSSADVEIRKLLHYSEILFKKSLYDESNKMLVRAKRIAEHHEKFPALLDVRKWEKRLMEKDAYAGFTYEDISAVLENDQLIIDKLTNFSEFWYIKSRLIMLLNKQGKVRDHAELAAFKKIIDNTLLKGEEKALSYETHYLYFQIYSAYFFGIGDYENSFRYMKKHLELIEENAAVFNEEPNKYFSVLSNMIYVCTQLRKFKEIPPYLEKLKSIPAAIADDMTEDMEIKLFSTIQSAELSYYMQTGAFDEAASLIPDIEKGLHRFGNKINKVRAAFFYFNISIVFFASGNYSKSLHWINRLLNDSSLDENADFYCFAKIFNLIVHLEMGNTDLIPYTLKSTIRYLEKRKRIYRFETIILNFINKIHQPRSSKNKKEETELYLSFASELKTLSKDPYEKTVFEYFDFISWAESKARNSHFSSVVKNQSKATLVRA